MSVIVTVYGPLRSATGGKHAEIDFSGGTVRDAIATVVGTYPRAESQLYDDGELRASVRVALNGEAAGFDDHCPADASISLHPAVQGGCRP